MGATDAEAQWEVLTVYTRTGLLRGEKVLLILDPSDLSDDDAVARLGRESDAVEAARDSGQLVIERSTSVYLPDGRFDKNRQLTVVAAMIERSELEGWRALRAAADMSWALRPGIDPDEVVDYEVTLEPLITDPGLIGLCWYDSRRLSSYLVAAAREVHPIQVLECLDAVEVTSAPKGKRIAGTAELSKRGDFVEAVRRALKQPGARGPVAIELDLTDISFMEAHCASRLMSFIASLPQQSTVIVRCGQLMELVLRGVGSDDVRQLELSVEEES